jgi:hypothetical protein
MEWHTVLFSWLDQNMEVFDSGKYYMTVKWQGFRAELTLSKHLHGLLFHVFTLLFLLMVKTWTDDLSYLS